MSSNRGSRITLTSRQQVNFRLVTDEQIQMPKLNPNERITIPVNLRLKASSVEVLARGSSLSPSDVLESRASQILDGIAEGGMILSATDVQDIEANYGKGIEASQDIVKATEGKAVKRDGQCVLTATIDPAYIEPLKEIAQMRGCSLEEHLSDIANFILANNWYSEIPPHDGITRIFRMEQERWFANELGLEQFTVEDLKAHVKSLKRGKKAVEPEAVTVG